MQGAGAGLLTSLAFSSWVAIGKIVSKIPIPLKPMEVKGCSNQNLTMSTTVLPTIITMAPSSNDR